MSGPITSANGRIVPRDQDKKKELSPEEYLINRTYHLAPELAKLLPKFMTAERMVRMAISTIRATPQIALCSELSFFGSIMAASQLGLEIGPLGHVYLVPYANECQFILGYQGMIELALRSGKILDIQPYLVYEGDHFEYELGLHEDVKHKPSKDPHRSAQPYTHVYASALYKEGFKKFEVLDRFQIEKRKKSSKSLSSDKSPWLKHEDAMVLKSAIRALWKWLPKSPEMVYASTIDMAPELEKPQSSAWDPDILSALKKQGVTAESDLKSKPIDVHGRELEANEKGSLQVA